MSATLEVRGLAAGYGAVRVLDGVDLDVGGGLTALIGANGAGKSTLLRVLAGLMPPSAGRVTLDGERIDGWPPHRLVDRGLVLVPEGRLVFAGLTVDDNLTAAAFPPRVRARRTANLDRVLALFPNLAERRRVAAGALSGGEQQMLAIGRALMTEPRVLLLDEATLGLAPGAATRVFDFVDRLRAEGLTILMAEQDVHRALARADRAYVLESGRRVAAGTGAELLGRDDIRRAYLGL